MKPTYMTPTYRTDVLEAHRNNPLITGFPGQFEPSEVHSRLKKIPTIPENELTSSNKLCLLYTSPSPRD